MKAVNFIMAFISGAALGLAAGVLCAPEKGTETRARIAEALRKRGINLKKDEMSQLVEEIAEEFEKKDQEENA
ncbi:MAG: YtxH domain-containing protein [Prevotellaceae bacterium]|nr:YtxH domain-containing protein [Prevotellaceae bacterium]MCD8285077.1 YtxH domain-containing protein [Prevotellaceae bacterium]MCD8304069.1 YtxH domain-containing protein [Prevotellaceae bacterium]